MASVMNLETKASANGWLSGTATADTVFLNVSSSPLVPGVFFAIALRRYRESDDPGGFADGVRHLPGLLVRDIVDGNAELRRHRLAEVDRHPGITSGFVLLRPQRAAGRADRDRHPKLAGWRHLVLQPVGACR